MRNNPFKSENKPSLLRTTISISLFIILGKFFGFAREAIIAAFYGATAETDAFFFANSMPTMILPAVCDSTAAAFTTLYVKRLTERGEKDGDGYAARMTFAALIMAAILAAIGASLTPVLVPVMAPGFAGQQLSLAVYLSRLTMWMLIFYMLESFLIAILNAKQHFLASRVSALLYSLIIIIITYLFGRSRSMIFLLLTMVIALVVQILSLMLFCRRCFHPSLKMHGIWDEWKALFLLTLPILLGNSVMQLNTIVDKALGSLLPDGSLSAVNYANTLCTLVISIFVTSLSTVLYPTLTSDAAKGDLSRYSKTLEQSLEGLSFLLIPISVISVLSSTDIVTIVYARGVFDQQAVEYTAVVLSIYAPMFVASGIREVLTRGFFALQDTKTPMRNSAIGVSSNIILSLLLVRPFGIIGISLGTTVSTFVTAGLLLRSAHRQLPSVSLHSYFKKLLIQLASGGTAAVALYLLSPMIQTIPYAILRFAASTIIGFTLYAVVLLLFHYPVPAELKRFVTKRS